MTLDRWLTCPECGYRYADEVVLPRDRLGAKCERCEHTQVVAARRLEP